MPVEPGCVPALRASWHKKDVRVQETPCPSAVLAGQFEHPSPKGGSGGHLLNPCGTERGARLVG